MLSHLFTSPHVAPGIMAEREKVVERIRKKEQEIQELESQVKDAKVYLQALQDVLRLFPRDANGSAGATDGALLRPGSLVAQAREAILKNGSPMHVNDIVKALGRELTRSNQTGVAGSIAAYVRKGEIFTRHAPNTFGLIELAKADSEESSISDEPPEDFGRDPPTNGPTQSVEEIDDDIPF